MFATQVRVYPPEGRQSSITNKRKLGSSKFNIDSENYLIVLQTCVENRQYIKGFVAEFSTERLCINVAIAMFVCVFGIFPNT